MRHHAFLTESAALAVVLIALVPGSASSDPAGDPAQKPFAVRVNASLLNVREGPTTGSSIVGGAASGQVYVAVARSGDWWKIWFSDRTAWVHGDFLVNDASTVAVANATALNVRSGPSANNAIIATVGRGTAFAIRSTASGWHRVDFAGRAGYVSASYVTTNGTPGPGTPTNPTRPVSSAGFIPLLPSGTGYYCVSVPERRWGTPRMVNGLERVARRWVTERPAGASPRVGIMDVSLKNGGDISGHASHEKGVDADIVLPRNDGQDSPRVDRFSSRYSRTGTQKLVNLCRAEMTVTHVFFNDPNVSGVSKWPNHDNHLHVRIK